MEHLIEVVNHSPKWAALFKEEAARLKGVMGSQILAAHHIGSTSVPGLRAKPVLDFLIEVQNIAQVDNYNEAMGQIGYESLGENGLPRRRYFRKFKNHKHTHHVHIWQRGDEEVGRHLAFRDYLISHPTRADAYGSLKNDLVERYGGDREQYIAGKDDFCKQTEKDAVDWQKRLDAYILKHERVHLIPLNGAQLYFYLSRPDQLQAALGLPISKAVVEPAVVKHALRVKKQRLINSPEHEFPWHTYWLVNIDSAPFGAGLIGFKGVPDNNGEVEIGYGIDPSWRNKGYTTEAAKLLIDWALKQESCQAVTAWSDKENVASARVLQKVGMKLGRETGDQYCWVIGSGEDDA